MWKLLVILVVMKIVNANRSVVSDLRFNAEICVFCSVVARLKKGCESCLVHCLKKPFRISNPQDLEPERDSFAQSVGMLLMELSQNNSKLSSPGNKCIENVIKSAEKSFGLNCISLTNEEAQINLPQGPFFFS